jgi:RNA polymerase sigma factor (sigma-70 family)
MARERSGGVLPGQLRAIYSLGAVGDVSDGQLLDRFLAREDPAASEAAFAALVDRHGAMVLRVCERILGDSHDAHDAYQATFLLLVRKAHSIRCRESVGDWLFRIARRVATRACVDAARRRHRLETLMGERRVSCADAGAVPSGDGPDHAELIAEVDRLPERFRAVVVLHYLEGLSAEAIARRLGCARGTVLSRLSRARDRLRSRLGRRGESIEAVWPVGAAASRPAWSGAVPPSLAHNTIRAAAALALGGATIESVVPAAVAGLARGVARALVFSHVRAAACLLIMATLGVTIGLAASLGAADEPSRAASGPGMPGPPRPASAKQQETRPPGKAREDVQVVRGQVLDPDGKPVVGAAIVLSRSDDSIVFGAEAQNRRLATSGAEGRFEAAVSSATIDEPGAENELAALAPGFGPGWIKLDRKTATDPMAIRLVRDDVPIEGRIMSLEGRGVVDATVSVSAILEPPDGFLAAQRARAGRGDDSDPWIDWTRVRPLDTETADLLAPVRTGPDGRFRITGVGRDRIAMLTIDGSSIEQATAGVVTTSDPAFQPFTISDYGESGIRLHGPRFELVAPPGRILEGAVRDWETGRPIPDAKVGSSWPARATTCDSQGRFRLIGMPRAGENHVTAVVGDQPYFKVEQPLGDPAGLGPVQADIQLKRGLWIEGRVIDRTTRRPVKADVYYVASRANPLIKDYPGAVIRDKYGVYRQPKYPNDADGHFRAVALPGEGTLVVDALEWGYLSARPPVRRPSDNVVDSVESQLRLGIFEAIVPIDPRKGDVAVIPDILLAPGRQQHLRPVAPDGRPVARTVNFFQEGHLALENIVAGNEYTFVHPRPGQPETVVILGEDRALGAFVDVKGDEPDPIRVALQPSGTVTGRLVDEDGQPRPNVRLELHYERRAWGQTGDSDRRFSPSLVTAPNGQFRIPGLVPGLTYTVLVVKRVAPDELGYEGHLHADRWSVKSGEVRDWGDVRSRGGD